MLGIQLGHQTWSLPSGSLKSGEGHRQEDITIQCNDSRGRSTPVVEESGCVGVGEKRATGGELFRGRGRGLCEGLVEMELIALSGAGAQLYEGGREGGRKRHEVGEVHGGQTTRFSVD